MKCGAENETMDFLEYDQLVRARFAQRLWRLGQTYFNLLAAFRPDLSEQIRGTALDPFHDDSRIESFLDWAAEHWA